MTLEVGTSSRELILPPYRSCTSCPQTQDLSSAMLSGYPSSCPMYWAFAGTNLPVTSSPTKIEPWNRSVLSSPLDRGLGWELHIESYPGWGPRDEHRIRPNPDRRPSGSREAERTRGQAPRPAEDLNKEGKRCLAL
eukprot:scaffold300_cov144-Isochrysis_galbana.AAC.2